MKSAAVQVHQSQPPAAARHEAPAQQPRKAKADEAPSKPARAAPAPHTGKHVDKSA